MSNREDNSHEKAQQASSSGRPAVKSCGQELQKELSPSLFISERPQPKVKRREAESLRQLSKSSSGHLKKAAKPIAPELLPVDAKQGGGAAAKASASAKAPSKHPELKAESNRELSSQPQQGSMQPDQRKGQPDPSLGKAPSSSELLKPLLESQPVVDEGPPLTPIEKARLRMQGKLLPAYQQEARPTGLGLSRKASNEKHEELSKEQGKGLAEQSKMQLKEEVGKLTSGQPPKQLNRRGSTEQVKAALKVASREPQKDGDEVALEAKAGSPPAETNQRGVVEQPLEGKKVAAEELLKPVIFESRHPVADAVKTESDPALLNAPVSNPAPTVDKAGSNAERTAKKVTRIGGSIALQPHDSIPPRQEFGGFIGTFGARSARASEQLARSGVFFDQFCPTVAVPPPEDRARTASPEANDFGNMLSSALGYKLSLSNARPSQLCDSNGLACPRTSGRSQQLGPAVVEARPAGIETSPFAFQAGPPGLQGKEFPTCKFLRQTGLCIPEKGLFASWSGHSGFRKWDIQEARSPLLSELSCRKVSYMVARINWFPTVFQASLHLSMKIEGFNLQFIYFLT